MGDRRRGREEVKAMDAILQRDEDAAVAEETGDCLAKKEGKQLWNNR